MSALQAVRNAAHLVVFTGAGVSVESGIPTFRDDGGFWTEYPPDEFANWPALTRKAATDPAKVAAFVKHVIDPVLAAQPNAAHRAIAAWQTRARVTVITQNIDGLHQAAGSETVYELHGSLWDRVDTAGQPASRLTHDQLADCSTQLGAVRTPWGLLRALFPIVRPDFALPLRPAIVLFQDALPAAEWTAAETALASCDAVLMIGCSGEVEPAASLARRAEAAGTPVLAVGPEPPFAGEWIEGRAGDVVPDVLG